MHFRSQLERLEERWCPASYNITDLGTLGGTSSSANAINAAGLITGGANTTAGVSHPYLWAAGGTDGVASNPQMRDLGVLPGFVNGTGHALNDAGQVAGEMIDANNHYDAFYWDGAAMQDLGTLGGAYTIGYGINNGVANVHSVQVVGQSTTTAINPDGSSVHHAFLWQNGVMADLNNLIPANSGWELTTAFGINDSQRIVGGGLHNGLQRAFVWQVGSSIAPTDLGILSGYAASFGMAVNQGGQVAGNLGATGTYPFLWTSGNMTVLPLLHGTSGVSNRAFGLNNAAQAQVVGDTFDVNAAVPDRALLWQNGKVIELTRQITTSAGWTNLNVARGINDDGKIVGSGTLAGGQFATGPNHAFLMTPAARGQKLMAAALPSVAVTQTLSTAQAAPLLVEAEHRWLAAGVDTSGLGTIRLQVGDLGGRTLGLADETQHTIYLDGNAAGWGWFVDRTPRDDSEFRRPGNQGEQHRIDLLTVLEHEIGHLLGRDHEAGGLMAEMLAAGTRLTPTSGKAPDWLAIDSVFAGIASPGNRQQRIW